MDPVCASFSQDGDVNLRVTANTKIQRLLDQILAKKDGRVVLQAETSGVQKLVSIAQLATQRTRAKQYNLLHQETLYVCLDFSADAKTPEGWNDN